MKYWISWLESSIPSRLLMMMSTARILPPDNNNQKGFIYTTWR
jgi:hypothetical protein